MKKPFPVGLLVEGNATTSTLLRLPGLANQIGPVRSTTLRVARRFSNALRAGHAVATYEELQKSRLVLIRVPDEALERIVDEIRKSQLALPRMCFAVCETWMTSTMFSGLRDAGACVATLLLVSEGDASWFVAEGDLPAVRQARQLVENSGGRVLQLRAGCKSLYFAADLLSTTLPLPLLTAAQTSLRQAGLSGKILSSIVNQLSNKLLRNLRAGTRMPSAGRLASVSPNISATYLAETRDKLAEIGMLIDQHLSEQQRKLI